MISLSNRFEDIDDRFRPESYWGIANRLEAILVNVQGTQRRPMIREYRGLVESKNLPM